MDYSTTGYLFVDEEFAYNHEFPLYKLKKPCCFKVIDGKPIESSLITHMTKLHMVIASHSRLILLFVTKSGYYPIVLGLIWLYYHNVNIRFPRNMVILNLEYCLNYCCEDGNVISIIGISIPIPEKQKLHIAMIARSIYTKIVKKKEKCCSHVLNNGLSD